MLTNDLSGLGMLTGAASRSITAENPNGAIGGGGRATTGPGASSARELGVGWKVSPCYDMAGGETLRVADIDGPGRITHIWITCDQDWWRRLVLRVWWDEADEPAIEVPLGDFFGQGWSRYSPLVSIPVAVNPNGGLNCFWSMPFGRHARIELQNLSEEGVRVFYQVDYEVGELSQPPAYLHATWRRSRPTEPGGPHEILPKVTGAGHYAGTYLAWSPGADGWWGEGEVKFFLDEDDDYPTICGTGTEDYFGGAWNFDVPGSGYQRFCTPYMGMPEVDTGDGLYRVRPRFGMYRWHVPDPIRFRSGVRATVQALGWDSRGRYLAAQDEIASTALYYLDKPNGLTRVEHEIDDLAVFLGSGVSSR